MKEIIHLSLKLASVQPLENPWGPRDLLVHEFKLDGAKTSPANKNREVVMDVKEMPEGMEDRMFEALSERPSPEGSLAFCESAPVPEKVFRDLAPVAESICGAPVPQSREEYLDGVAEFNRTHAFHEAKRLCGLCAHKEDDVWKCLLNGICPAPTGTCVAFEHKPAPYRDPLQGKVKGAPVPKGVHMIYLGRPSRPGAKQDGARAHKGVITVAVRINESPNVLEMGISFWPPGEPWCKMMARDAALEWLNKVPLVSNYLYEPKRMARQLIFAVADHDWERLEQFGVSVLNLKGAVPSWTKHFWTLFVDSPKGRRMSHLLDAFKYSVPDFRKLDCRPGAILPYKPLRSITDIMKSIPDQVLYREPVTAMEHKAQRIMARMAADIARLDFPDAAALLIGPRR